MRGILTLLKDLWFIMRTLAYRGRFMTGKASVVEADIRSTDTHITEVLDASGRATGGKLLANYYLNTRRPRTGRQGWELFVEISAENRPHKTATLECSYCGHIYVISVVPEGDPLASAQTGGKLMATPASYSCDWFLFTVEHLRGDPTLMCAHCEQKGPPRIEFLG